ncbi:MAG: hypothetical protein IPI25_00295 [Candidatus Brocadia sp.]|nr:MAG: hypothetical protein IPI25_00295 [Candidatus Brocadia sp.]
MPDQTITCPYCTKEIPLTETLSHQIKEGLQKEFELKARERELKLARREKSLAEEMKTLEDARKSIDQQVSQKLQAERERLKLESRKEVEDTIRVELKDLKDQNVEKERKLAEAQRVELEFRKRVRELEELGKNQELEIARKLDEERKLSLKRPGKKPRKRYASNSWKKKNNWKTPKRPLTKPNARRIRAPCRPRGRYWNWAWNLS